jgi:hypothetical protein
MAVLDTNEILFTAFEPKVQNRFIMRLADTGIEAFLVKGVTAPSYSDEEIVLHHMNSYRKIRGKRMWNDMTMTLYDPITPSGAQAVMEWARLSYESVTGRAGYSDLYKKDVTLDILGPAGDVIGEWLIIGAFVREASFGEYNFESSEAVEISMTVSMDYCVLNF